MTIERIAAGVEVINDNGVTYYNLNGVTMRSTTSYETTVQILAEQHAKGYHCLYGSDPLKYVEGAAGI